MSCSDVLTSHSHHRNLDSVAIILTSFLLVTRFNNFKCNTSLIASCLPFIVDIFRCYLHYHHTHLLQISLRFLFIFYFFWFCFPVNSSVHKRKCNTSSVSLNSLLLYPLSAIIFFSFLHSQ